MIDLFLKLGAVYFAISSVARLWEMYQIWSIRRDVRQRREDFEDDLLAETFKSMRDE